MSVSPGEASVNESQGSVEVCLEADGELEMGTEIVIVLSTSNITASGTYTNSLHSVYVITIIVHHYSWFGLYSNNGKDQHHS